MKRFQAKRDAAALNSRLVRRPIQRMVWLFLLPTFAAKYCVDEHSAVYGSTLVSVSTVMCIVTVPMWIYIFNAVL